MIILRKYQINLSKIKTIIFILNDNNQEIEVITLKIAPKIVSIKPQKLIKILRIKVIFKWKINKFNQINLYNKIIKMIILKIYK